MICAHGSLQSSKPLMKKKQAVICALLSAAAYLLCGCAESAVPEESVALFSGRDRNELYQAIFGALTKFQDHAEVYGDPDSAMLTEVCQQIQQDHPEVYWFGGWYSTASSSTHPDSTYIAFDIPNDATAQQFSDMQKELLDASEAIRAEIPADANDYEKALFVHDYLIEHTNYADEGPEAGNAYGCIVNHAAYCEGYSRAFLLLMNQLGIPAGLTSGTGENGGNHMWNYLKLGENYYWADVTWDDTLIDGSDAEQLNHYYCFLNDDLMLRSHTIGKNQLFIPTCSSMEMNYFVQNGWYLETYDCDAACTIIKEQLKNDKNPIELMLDSKESYDAATRDLFDDNRFWLMPELPFDLDYCTLSCCAVPSVLRIDLYHKDDPDTGEGEAIEMPEAESPPDDETA